MSNDDAVNDDQPITQILAELQEGQANFGRLLTEQGLLLHQITGQLTNCHDQLADQR